LPERYQEILTATRPKLEQVYKDELGEPLPEDIFTTLKVTGFGVRDLSEQPVRWDVSFKSTGDKYLGVSIPFAGNTAMEPEVDIC
jgi:hypothetical protein